MLASPSPVPINHHWTVNFPEHLAALRKQKGMTQQQLADRVGVHVVQLRRYEAGTPSLPWMSFAAWPWL